MLSYDEALQFILERISCSQSETISLNESSGRFLAEAPTAKIDLPPFLTSSVDGYAIAHPIQEPLAVAGEFAAGSEKHLPMLKPREAVQVFTGSPLPPNTGSVVMIEDVERSANHLTLKNRPQRGDNLRPRGEELTAGQELLPAGLRITPPVLALLANSGNDLVKVTRRPRISIVEIGSELQSPGKKLKPGGIYSANGIALAAACEALGAATTVFRSTDHFAELKQELAHACRDADVVITSGGVSVGKHDHVKEIWEAEGVEKVFWQVAIRPGKPLYFGFKPGGPLIFGLPGNPVSTLVTFFLFVRPALLRMNGHRSDEWFQAKTGGQMASSETVEIFLRVGMLDGCAIPMKNQGSHMISGLAQADSLLRIPRGAGMIPPGSHLPALSLSWNS